MTRTIASSGELDGAPFGGFPAPFIAAREAFHAKWIRTRRDLLLREDLRDLSKVEDVAAVELLVKLFQGRVGGLLNYQNLANDLSSSVDSVRLWVRLLETLYYCYRIYPYTKDIKRSLRKTPKLYLWDWSEIADEAAANFRCSTFETKKNGRSIFSSPRIPSPFFWLSVNTAIPVSALTSSTFMLFSILLIPVR